MMFSLNLDTRMIFQIAIELWGCLFSFALVIASFTMERKFLVNKFSLAMHISVFFLLLCDSVAWTFRGSSGTFGFWAVRIANPLVFVFQYLSLLFYTLYIKLLLPKNERRKVIFSEIFSIVLILALVILLIQNSFTHNLYYFDEENRYNRAGLNFLIPAVPVFGMIVLAVSLIIVRKNFSKIEFISLFTFVFLPTLATIIQTFFYGISLTNISILVSVIILFVSSYRNYYELMIKNERKLNSLRTKMMLSQIKPHFIYNTLSTIRYLCQTDTDEAVHTIDNFSAYLRANIDSIESDEMIPLSAEIEHVKNYVNLEQKRFGERVKTEFDISAGEDFLLPPLTIQPLVENAVKHGITQKKIGGKVKVAVREEKSVYTIEVIDDGVGFDATKQHDGTGMKNVRQRLEMLCGGTLNVQSGIGKGTCAVISIPKLSG